MVIPGGSATWMILHATWVMILHRESHIVYFLTLWVIAASQDVSQLCPIRLRSRLWWWYILHFSYSGRWPQHIFRNTYHQVFGDSSVLWIPTIVRVGTVVSFYPQTIRRNTSSGNSHGTDIIAYPKGRFILLKTTGRNHDLQYRVYMAARKGVERPSSYNILYTI